ncbi:ornithine carbamoyltransferase [Candidatus Woesearchaeota archaeon]|jgi:ornithine carbamoyltransferase|nr:ornithine carbamoyltransferase [Candidatus Woesearchaeota archaeon]MBT5272881.1 ornithine carbamoyltransferase [Candidatus Woesearchaeota archaeon]MBT6041347.1 ornithine carbamoyltransferase [Candidatus Woesearchaeota archaeon]MBT6337230.1 ornithine carbamoyltransferase [Candidatus Woesearchaeota archaeon]MBT7927107.1 ornithine carbamoyltransferase [Candidatus Woesearchaeota archaeon]
MKDLLSLKDVNKEFVLSVIEKAIDMKQNPDNYRTALKDKTLLMIFEKPSLRTRVSFEVGMTQMGGHAIYYDVSTSPLGRKETIEDTAKTSERYVEIIMARLNHFSDCKALAENAKIPVIDALSDMNHPCQILCDLQTIKEKFGKLNGLTLAYVGDSENNVTYSLMHGCAHVGINVRVGCPNDPEHKPKQEIVEEAKLIAAQNGSTIEVFHNAADAVKDADVVYTDSWMSYHIPVDQMEVRKQKLMPYQVTSALMQLAKPTAVFMNCLPAMRGLEQTAEVVDGPQSIVFDQAENRLHVQKAIMLKLLGMF